VLSSLEKASLAATLLWLLLHPVMMGFSFLMRLSCLAAWYFFIVLLICSAILLNVVEAPFYITFKHPLG
jgi:antibiotic biosynthesis monooxygenase (ABM) superfamily enzyme